MNITVTAEIHPTEDAASVRRAVERLFPDLAISEESERIVGTGTTIEDLEVLKKGIETQAIKDTARSSLSANAFGNATTLYLNKQAAFMGKVNISNDGPLGPVVVRITGDLDTVIDYVAPSTIEGSK